MRKKYKTLEEVRAANAARAREWRKANRWEARVKKARAYGTRTLKVDIKGYGTVDVPEWVLAVALPQDHIRVLEKEYGRTNEGKLGEMGGLSGADDGYSGDDSRPSRRAGGNRQGAMLGGEREAGGSRSRAMGMPGGNQDTGENQRCLDWIAGKTAERTELARKKKVVSGKGGSGVEIRLEGV